MTKNQTPILLLFLAISVSATICSSEQEMDSDAHYSKRTKLIGYPAYPYDGLGADAPKSAADLRQTLRMISMPHGNITPEEANTKATELRRQGFNAMLSESNRYLFRDSDEENIPAAVANAPSYDRVIANTKNMADACHRQGLKFYLHLTCTMVHQGLLDKHPDWAAIDLVTGKPIVNTYGTTNTCINNDNFMAEFFRRLDRLIKETGADGIMQDEIQFFGYTMCGCPSCREKFRKETGYNLPDEDHPGSGPHGFADNPSFHAWLEWRREKVVARMQQVRELFKKYNPDNTVLHYLCNNTGEYGYVSAGLIIDDFPKYADSPGCECEPHDHAYIYYWAHIIYEMKYLRAVAEQMNTAPWAVFHPRMSGDHTWNWLLTMSQGCKTYWWWPREEERWQPLISVAWEARHEKLLMNQTSAGNVGVPFSINTRDRNRGNEGGGDWIHGFSSTCNALTDGHIPYKVLLDSDMSAEKLTGSVKTLLLLNTGSVSDSAVDAVRTFVRNGGVLIASAATSICDNTGKKRSDFGLADVFGCSYNGMKADGKTLSINPASNLTAGKLNHKDAFVLLKNIAPDVRILGTMQDALGQDYPGILARDFGKGKVVYVAGKPETRYLYHYYNINVIKPGSLWKDHRDPQYGRLLCELAGYENKEIPVKISNVPQGIVVEAYRHKVGSLTGIQVHLANFLGGRVKEGKVPFGKDIDFPEVKPNLPDPEKPITVSVRSSKVGHVYVISPDFDQVVELPFTNSGDYSSISLPVFYRYFILYFCESGEDEILSLAPDRKAVKAIPAAKELIVEEREALAGAYDPAAVTVFSDEKEFVGGDIYIHAFDYGWYKGEPCRVIYGSQSGVSTATIEMVLKEKPQNPILEIGAMDDDRPSTHAPIEIKINGNTVFRGENTCPNAEWAVRTFPIRPEYTKTGENIVEITNTGSGTRGSCPWFGISYVRLKGK